MTTTPTFAPSYRAEFASVALLDQITEAAVSDQQKGIPVARGRRVFDTVAEQSHYTNAWLASFRVNGAPKVEA